MESDQSNNQDSRTTDQGITSTEELINRLLNGKSPKIRESAASQLGQTPKLEFNDDITDALILVLRKKREKPSVRAMAAEAVRHHDIMRASRTLIECFQDKSAEVRYAAVSSIGFAPHDFGFSGDLLDVALNDHGVVSGKGSIADAAKNSIVNLMKIRRENWDVKPITDPQIRKEGDYLGLDDWIRSEVVPLGLNDSNMAYKLLESYCKGRTIVNRRTHYWAIMTACECVAWDFAVQIIADTESGLHYRYWAGLILVRIRGGSLELDEELGAVRELISIPPQNDDDKTWFGSFLEHAIDEHEVWKSCRDDIRQALTRWFGSSNISLNESLKTKASCQRALRTVRFARSSKYRKGGMTGISINIEQAE